MPTFEENVEWKWMLSKKTEEPWPMPCSWPEKDGKVSSSAAWSPSLPKLVRQYDEEEEEDDYGHTCDDADLSNTWW